MTENQLQTNIFNGSQPTSISKVVQMTAIKKISLFDDYGAYHIGMPFSAHGRAPVLEFSNLIGCESNRLIRINLFVITVDANGMIPFVVLQLHAYGLALFQYNFLLVELVVYRVDRNYLGIAVIRTSDYHKSLRQHETE